MDFTHDEEQQALRDAVRGLVGKAYADFENRRRAAATDPGFDRALWARMAEMGLLGLPFGEDDGGVGAGPIEVAIVAEEIGRVLAPEPYLASVVWAGGLVDRVGDSAQRREILGGLAAGKLLVMPALAEPDRRWSDSAGSVIAVLDEGGWRVSGVKEPVLHGAEADLLVVSAALSDGRGTGLFLVDGTADGVIRNGYRTHDGSRAAKVTFDHAPVIPLGEAGVDVTPQITAATDLARVMAANEAIGAMQAALRLTSGYLTSRKQFGVTLNSFQALTFRAADMYVALELATSLAVWATMVAASGSAEQIADAAARASFQVNQAGRHIGQEAIQLHGGIGLTAEYSIGHYTSRLTALEHLLGDAGFQLNALTHTLADHDLLDPLA